MITMTTVTCAVCGKTSQKKLSEINRQKKKGRTKFYCNRKCAGKNAEYRIEPYKNHFKEHKYIRQPDEYSAFRWYMKQIRKNSKKRNHIYDIDISYLKQLWENQRGICPISNRQLILRSFYEHSVEKINPYHASLDRIDSNIGYVKGNVRFVALMFNYAKNIFTDKEVIDFCKEVVINIGE